MSARTAAHPVDPLFLERWSPRAFDGSIMPQEDLLTIFEAARWAPSAFNTQPWRILYAHCGDANWARFLDLLIPWNQSWAYSASVLLFILSDSLMEMKPGKESVSHTHSFDAGAAWACLAWGTGMGYLAHGRLRASTSIASAPSRRSRAVPGRGGGGDREARRPRHAAGETAGARTSERPQTGRRVRLCRRLPGLSRKSCAPCGLRSTLR
jgi:nitroreductase